MLKMSRTKIEILIIAIIFIFFAPTIINAGTLVCTVGPTCANTAVFRLSGTSDAHAEFPDQSNYTGIICCGGVTGLGTTCSGTYATVMKLSTSTTNAHVEQNSLSNYANSLCLSVATGSVSVAYQADSCTGYDTTIASMSDTTNAHVGGPDAYSTKICGTAAASSGVAIVVTDGGVAYGTVVLNGTVTNSSDVQIVRVDTGPANLDIKSTIWSDGANNWTLGTSNGSAQVKWEFSPDNSNWTTFAVAGTDYDLANNVAQEGTQNLYLRLTMPTAVENLNQYSSTVTITATAP
ncbi:MAG: hypothetical protein V1902_01310 [Candidatus Falkowbacteria bacterium]